MTSNEIATDLAARLSRKPEAATTDIPLAMSYEDWQSLRLGGLTPAEYAGREFDHRNLDDLTGTDGEKRAIVYIGARHPLLNPKGRRAMSEHQRGHSAWSHFARTILRGDDKAARLLNELAQTGVKLMHEAADLKNNGKARPAADEYIVVASSGAEAEIIRSWMDFAVGLVDDGFGLGSGKPAFLGPKSMPSLATLEAFAESIRPALLDPAVEANAHKVAIIAARGGEAVAAEIAQTLASAAAENGLQITFVPGKSQDLWVALRDAGVKTFRAGEKDDHENDFNELAVKAADQAIVVWNGDEADASLIAAARAAEHGTLIAVADLEGEALDVLAVAEHAMNLNPSRMEIAQAASLPVFAIAAASPEGRLALSMIRGLSGAAIDALASTPYTLNEIVDLTKTDAGREMLLREYNVPGVVFSLLGDDRALANARESFERIQADCRNSGVAIVGPESYPAALAMAPNRPAVLFVQAKDPAALGNIGGMASVIGDEKLMPYMASRAGRLAAEIEKANTAIVSVENHGLPLEVTPKVLVLSTGHTHYGIRAALEWTPRPKEACTVAVGAQGSYLITFDRKTRTLDLAYGEATAEPKVLNSEALPERGEKTSEIELVKFAASRLKDKAHAHETAILTAPERDLRNRVVEAGGFVISKLPPVEATSYYSAVDGARASVLSIRTDMSKARAVELAAQMGEVVAFTQIGQTPSTIRAIDVAVSHGKRMVAITPPAEHRASPLMTQTVALASAPGAEVAYRLALSGQTRSTLETTYGDKYVCRASGGDLKATASLIAERVSELNDKRVARTAQPVATPAHAKAKRGGAEVEIA